MLCSIIIPLYNKEAFIEIALQSILKQHYQNFEVIVVDDGSTDSGPFRVGAIQDQRIHLIKQANAGVSCARNRGIELAKGELVCFLDADDWYNPMYLETIITMAKLYPDISFFATGYKCVSAHNNEGMVGHCDSIRQFELVDNFFDHWLRFGQFIFTGSVAARREHLTQLQPCFPPGEQMGEDLDFFFRSAERSDLVFCSAPLVDYRVDVEGSLCATHKVDKLLPTFIRLEQRALRRQMPEKHCSSALRLVTEEKVTVVRNLLIAGRRYDACMELLGGLREIKSRRWWATMIMCAICTPSLVRRWEHWRDIPDSTRRDK